MAQNFVLLAQSMKYEKMNHIWQFLRLQCWFTPQTGHTSRAHAHFCSVMKSTIISKLLLKNGINAKNGFFSANERSKGEGKGKEAEGIICWVAIWLDKGWGNPDWNVVVTTICCWWTCGFAWWRRWVLGELFSSRALSQDSDSNGLPLLTGHVQ